MKSTVRRWILLSFFFLGNAWLGAESFTVQMLDRVDSRKMPLEHIFLGTVTRDSRLDSGVSVPAGTRAGMVIGHYRYGTLTLLLKSLMLGGQAVDVSQPHRIVYFSDANGKPLEDRENVRLSTKGIHTGGPWVEVPSMMYVTFAGDRPAKAPFVPPPPSPDAYKTTAEAIAKARLNPADKSTAICGPLPSGAQTCMVAEAWIRQDTSAPAAPRSPGVRTQIDGQWVDVYDTPPQPADVASGKSYFYRDQDTFLHRCTAAGDGGPSCSRYEPPKPPPPTIVTAANSGVTTRDPATFDVAGVHLYMTMSQAIAALERHFGVHAVAIPAQTTYFLPDGNGQPFFSSNREGLSYIAPEMVRKLLNSPIPGSYGGIFYKEDKTLITIGFASYSDASIPGAPIVASIAYQANGKSKDDKVFYDAVFAKYGNPTTCDNRSCTWDQTKVAGGTILQGPLATGADDATAQKAKLVYAPNCHCGMWGLLPDSSTNDLTLFDEGLVWRFMREQKRILDDRERRRKPDTPKF